jgi:hypothetical protein
MLRPAQHGFDEIAVVEIDLEWQLGEVGSGEIKSCLRQVDAVIVADLGSAQCGLHRTAVAAGNVEEAEGRRENVVQGFWRIPLTSRWARQSLSTSLRYVAHCSWNCASAAASTTVPPGWN